VPSRWTDVKNLGRAICWLVRAAAPIDATHAGEELHQLRVIDRLDEMRIEPSVLRAAPVVFLTPAGECDKRRLTAPRQRAHPSCNFVAVEFRHSDVEQQYIGPKRFGNFDC